MSNPVTPFRNNLFGSRPTIQEALDYAEMLINTLSSTDQVAVRTAFGVLINTIDNKVTNTPERIAVVQLISSIINEQLNVTMNDVDEQVSNWMDSHLYDRLEAHKVVREDNLRDKMMEMLEHDNVDDQISNWMSNNFDLDDYNVGDAIEQWMDNNLDDKVYDSVNSISFTVEIGR
jgi:hypothetical protein